MRPNFPDLWRGAGTGARHYRRRIRGADAIQEGAETVPTVPGTISISRRAGGRFRCRHRRERNDAVCARRARTRGELGATTAIVACSPPPAEMLAAADIAIVPVTGPEVVTGSTRMKAGTATKMVLNAISTGSMIRLGKTYGNLMVDLQATNNKLRDRGANLMEVCEVNRNAARDLRDGEAAK